MTINIGNNSWMLNSTSKIIGQPESVKVKLWKHQLAMLYKCLQLEKTSNSRPDQPYGFLADGAGAGKTGVMISLMLCEKDMLKKTQNIIVTPQNIYYQWINEIKKFAGDELKVKKFIEYGDMIDLYDPDKRDVLKEYDVIITTDLYYKTIIDILEDSNLNIRRFIFDEVDNLSDIINEVEASSAKKRVEYKKKYEESLTASINQLMLENPSMTTSEATQIANSKNNEYKLPEIKNKISWFISASLNNLITEEGLRLKGKVIPNNILQNLICKCDEQFIKESITKLQPPIIEKHICSSIADTYSKFMSIEQLDSINSMCFNNVRCNTTNIHANTDRECIDIIKSDYNQKIKRNVQQINSIKKFSFKLDIADEIKNKENEIVFYQNILEKFNADIENNPEGGSKEDKYHKIYNYLKNLRDSSKVKIDSSKVKILIFSDFQDSFRVISKILEELNFNYKELIGGNPDKINNLIDNYKNGDLQVLFIDSITQGCGMNLENTSHILCVHKTSDILYNQIVGRAQRPGRTSTLKIDIFLNENENI